ncbi:hypothetical protein SDC9_160753 [bioreactor metagenome]|uniref:Uncharacterized protein n=1 Tax=bioreactor metagenome TaxID=1076179 RepID=A0A645FIS8_9ZZZZ
MPGGVIQEYIPGLFGLFLNDQDPLFDAETPKGWIYYIAHLNGQYVRYAQPCIDAQGKHGPVAQAACFKGRLDLFNFRLCPWRLNRLHLITSNKKAAPVKETALIVIFYVNKSML